MPQEKELVLCPALILPQPHSLLSSELPPPSAFSMRPVINTQNTAPPLDHSHLLPAILRRNTGAFIKENSTSRPLWTAKQFCSPCSTRNTPWARWHRFGERGGCCTSSEGSFVPLHCQRAPMNLLCFGRSSNKALHTWPACPNIDRMQLFTQPPEKPSMSEWCSQPELPMRDKKLYLIMLTLLTLF